MTCTEICWVLDCNTPTYRVRMVEGFLGWGRQATIYDVAMCEGHYEKTNGPSTFRCVVNGKINIRSFNNMKWLVLGSTWMI